MRLIKRISVAALLVIATLPAQENIRPLTILHTNDLHAHLMPDHNGMGGFAYLAAELRSQRSHCDACLYLNAGDLVQGTPVSTIYHGEPVYSIANMLGIDVSTLGNHEFDYGWRAIQQFVKIANFPIVSANVLDASGRPATGKAYVIVKLGGMRVAVVGAVLGDLVGDFVTREVMGGWHTIPVIEGVRKAVAEIGNRADLIIVLGHIHDEETEQIFREIPRVAVIVAGHDHKGYPKLKQENGHVAVEMKGYGVELGRLDLKVDVAHGTVVASEWKRIPIDSRTITPAPDVAKVISSWEAKVSKVVDVPIGEASHKIEGPELRSLVERAMAEETGADFAWVNRGNLRATLPAGKLQARDVWDLLPFDNHIVIGKFKGSELPPAMTKDHPVEPDKEYTVATTDFTALNQAAPDQLAASGLNFPKTGPLQRDAVIDWIKKKKVVP